MDPRHMIESFVRSEYELRQAAPGIYSVLPPGQHDHRYDRRAAQYDAVIGSEPYNRLVWGTSREHYAEFARQAIRAGADTPLVDAGCGSMVFSASVYARSARPVIAIDQSLGMLQQAQLRIQRLAGHDHAVIFLQADLFDLPLLAASVQTVLCMGMLHLFADIQPVLAGLRALCRPGAELFLSSLVRAGRPADRYLELLARSGEVAPPIPPDALQALAAPSLGPARSFALHGNMSYGVYQLPGA